MERVYDDTEALKGIQEYHASYYDYECLRPGSQTRREYEKVLGSLEKTVGDFKGKYVYEIGYGSGAFLSLASERGWRVGGTDTSQENWKRAQQKYGLNLECGLFDPDRFTKDCPDVVVLWDVIEHLRDPAHFTKTIYKVLRPQGLLVVATPNAESLLHRAAGWLYYLSGGALRRPVEVVFAKVHITHFTQKTLGSLLGEAGFGSRMFFQSETDLKRYGFSLSLRLALSAAFQIARLCRSSNRLIAIARKCS